MSVIILILKIIGIILLILLGVILSVLFAALLVPVRYRIFGQAEDNNEVHIRVNWLLHVLSFYLDYEAGETRMGIKACGVPVRSKPKKTSAGGPEGWEEETGEKQEASAEKSAQTMLSEEAVEEGGGCSGQDAGTAENDGGSRVRETPESQPQHGIRKWMAQVGEFFQKLRKIKQMLPKLWKRALNLRQMLFSEANKNALLAVLTELKYLLKHFKFRKLFVNLRFCAGDPAATGQALGVLCLFPLLYRYQVNLEPDFESEEFYVRGVFEMKGRMRVVHFVVSLVRLWKKKEVRNLTKKLLG